MVVDEREDLPASCLMVGSPGPRRNDRGTSGGEVVGTVQLEDGEEHG